MNDRDNYCPILKRAWRDKMELARQMAAEKRGPACEAKKDSGRLSGSDCRAAMGMNRREESEALPNEEITRHQAHEVAFDLTKGGFPCYRK
jgi:hypothetical protein